ncbi:MAG: class I SAM-dependent methyltransferase [Hyphomicrobiaceae bacterium]
MPRIKTIGGVELELPNDINNYWDQRLHHDLYRLTVATAKAIFHDAQSAIDVGCYTSGLICELDWIKTRVASDIQKRLTENWMGVSDVRFVPGDAFALDFSEAPFDLVISNQTVEHLDDPTGFIAKLLTLGRGLIVSTTYEVPFGTIDGHIQDPISLEKFKSWFPCELDAWFVCHHPTSRKLRHVVGVLKQSHPARGQ